MFQFRQPNTNGEMNKIRDVQKVRIGEDQRLLPLPILTGTVIVEFVKCGQESFLR